MDNYKNRYLTLIEEPLQMIDPEAKLKRRLLVIDVELKIMIGLLIAIFIKSFF